LVIAIATFVSVDKVVKEERNVTLLQITAVAKFVRDLGRNVPRPALCGIESNNPDRVFVSITPAPIWKPPVPKWSGSAATRRPTCAAMFAGWRHCAALAMPNVSTPIRHAY
jgi:hypothetical protein